MSLTLGLGTARRTELERLHEDHVMNYWHGHGSAIANKHHLQVTDEDWVGALGRGDTGGDVRANPQESGVITRMKKPREMQGFDDSRHSE